MRGNKLFIFFALLVFVNGCAGSQQAQHVEKSGFIPGYVKLRPGGDGEALLRYINPAVNWRDYKKIIIDPVTIWREQGAQTEKVSPEDLQQLADYFWLQIREELRNDYEIVYKPGLGVMKLSVAITEAEASNPALDTISSVVPQLRLLTGAKGLASGGVPGFVGVASVEAKMTNSQTGTVLLAGADRRAGTKNPSGAGYKWNDVEQAYQYWAKALRWRLCKLRGDKNCVKPEE